MYIYEHPRSSFDVDVHWHPFCPSLSAEFHQLMVFGPNHLGFGIETAVMR